MSASRTGRGRGKGDLLPTKVKGVGESSVVLTPERVRVRGEVGRELVVEESAKVGVLALAEKLPDVVVLES